MTRAIAGQLCWLLLTRVCPGSVFSNSIKLMLERQKFTLYQQEMLLEKAKVTLYQHAVRESKNHTLPAGYAPLEGYAAREAKIYTLPAGYAKISP